MQIISEEAAPEMDEQSSELTILSEESAPEDMEQQPPAMPGMPRMDPVAARNLAQLQSYEKALSSGRNVTLSDTGEVVQQEAPWHRAPGAFVSEMGDVAGFGVPKAALKLSGVDTDIAQREYPKTAFAGKMVGALLTPLGRAQTTSQLIKQGVALGATFGATGEVAEKGTEARPLDIAKSTVVGAATGGIIAPIAGKVVPFVAKSVYDIAKGSIKQLKAFVAPTRVTAGVDALNPGLGKYAGAKMASTERAVKNIMPHMKDMADEIGVDASTAQGFADAASHGKIKVWDLIEKAEGREMGIDAVRAIDAVEKVVNDNINKRMHPEGVRQAEEWITNIMKDRQGPFKASEAEKILSVINAELSAFYEKSGIAKEAALKTSPLMRAKYDVANVLRKELDDTMEGATQKMKDLRELYGSFKSAAEMAQNQAARQAKLDGALGLYEGLGTLMTVSEALKTGHPISALAGVGVGKAMRYMGTPNYKFSRLMGTGHDIPKNLPIGSDLRASVDGVPHVVEFLGKVGDKIKIKTREGRVMALDVDKVGLMSKPKAAASPLANRFMPGALEMARQRAAAVPTMAAQIQPSLNNGSPIQQEKADHPWMDDATAAKVVQDELAVDPNAYSK